MARYIPDDVLETIRQRADIVEVVQSYVPTLKRAGSLWKACCPFHHEKTPSFTVNPARGIYKCFGCGQGGNVFTFIREMEKLDFPNAAELLARKYNIIIPDTPPPNARFGRGRSAASSGSAESPESSYALRERLFLLHEKLAAWYASQLRDFPDSPVARYFATRGLPAETAARYIAPAPLNSLESMTIEKDGDTAAYTLERTGETDPDTAEEKIICRMNGEEISYDAFAAAYERLLTVTVSGQLPDGAVWKEAHTKYTFRTVSGGTYTVAFSAWDGMHDAVTLNGETLFYLIERGAEFTLAD